MSFRVPVMSDHHRPEHICLPIKASLPIPILPFRQSSVGATLTATKYHLQQTPLNTQHLHLDLPSLHRSRHYKHRNLLGQQYYRHLHL